MYTNANKREPSPPRKKMLVEALEQRILYSADAGALLLDHHDTTQTAEVRIIDDGIVDHTVVAETSNQQHEIVFVDANIEGYQTFVDDILAQQSQDKAIEIVVLNQETDGIKQISEVLNSYDNVSAIHIISHGSAGNVQIGNISLNADTLLNHATEIQAWGDAFTNDADILLYGCNVTASTEGLSFIETLSQLSGADVAASDDITANALANGDWVLESTTGDIEAQTLNSRVWQGALALTTEGDETLVNQTTAGTQNVPDTAGGKQVASDADGNYVVIWVSDDASGTGIYGRRYDADGVALGNEFLINTYTTSTQSYPSVAMDANGNFVVTWESNWQDGSGNGIYAQRFNAAGVAQGAEFQVNTYTAFEQIQPAIAMDANGNFVITWQSDFQDGSGYGIYAQRFNAAGVAQGAEFQVNTYTFSYQQQPDIAMDANGNFVIAWQSYAQDGSLDGIYAQRFDAAGVAQGAEFQVNTYSTYAQSDVSVAMNASGDFVVTWQSNVQDGSNYGIFGQRYNAAGVAQGAEFQVNTFASYEQSRPSVAMEDNGRFIVTWTSNAQDGSVYGIYAQAFHADGTKDGAELQVATSTSGTQSNSSVTWSGASGNIIISWSGNGTQTGNVDTQGIFFQRYSAPIPPAINTTVADANYVENSTIAIDSGITVTDNDSANLTSATITISNNYVNGEDVLTFTDQLGITGSWNATTGVLTLTGSSSVANYQTALRSITYQNTSESPNTSTRTLTITANDGVLNSSPATRNITVTQVNDAGTFGGDLAATIDEDNVATGTASFTDVIDGYSVNSFAINTAASNGVATINTAGNWTYTPSANYNGTDSFTIQVTDDDGNVETQVISITVTQVNDAGSFSGDVSATTNEDTATAGTITFVDTADGFTTPNFTLVSAASNGTAAIDSAGNWTYTPSANYNGTDSFTIQVTDDDGNVETQVISITVTQVNDAGTFGGDTAATTNEDTATAGTVTFVDTADGFTTPNFTLGSAASNGTAAIDSAGNWTYTPSAHYNGSDSFTVQVTDDDGNVETHVINITVTAVNDAGTFGGDTSATTNEDTATAGTVTFVDTADGFTTPNFTLVSAASNGTAAIDSAGNWTYTPSAHYNGSDSFTVQVTDDDGNVETQVINITVTAVNDAGTFGGDVSATTNEDTATAGTVTFVDTADGFTTPNFTLLSAATNGAAAIDSAGNWTYSPSAHYNGADSFTVQVTDDDGNVETQVINITVTAVNDAGTFGGDVSATTNEDTATAGTVTFVDTADGFTTPNFTLVSAATNGTAAIDSAGNWTYTPSANYNGADSFTVQVTDDDGNVETQVISINVTQVNDAGSFGGDTAATTNEDTATAGTVTFVDTADGFTTPNFTLVSAAANGTAAIDSAGNWTYTPSAHYNGSDSFTVQVTDDDGNVETQVISITVTQVNDAGTFGGDVSATTNEDTATAGTVTFVDTADGFTTPNFTLLSAATNGTAAIDSAGNWTYTPSAHYNGADSFTVQVTDDDGNVETQVISINVTQVNDAGSFGGDTAATTNEDTATAGTVTFVDTADGFTTPNFTLLSAATNGTAAIDSAGNWTYSPSAHYNGADSFTVQVTDDDGNVETQVISITVTQVNDAGSFGGDTAATTNEDTATAGTVTFVDTADGFTTPNFTLLSAATNGTAAIDSAGNWTYSPSAHYNGADSFTVQVTDDDGNVETQVINITVTAVNDAGTFGGDVSATTNEDTATAGTVTFVDTADGFTTPNFTLVSAATNGTAAIDSAGNWTYTPSTNYNGSDSFTVQVTDDDGNLETQVISITVNQVNDAGTFGGDLTATIDEDNTATGTATFTDTADGFTTPNFTLLSAATNGTAAIDSAGNWTYTPSANYNGADSFTVQVTDDDGNVETQVISINVTQVNDAGSFGGDTAATTNEDTATAGTVTFVDTADGFTTPNFTLVSAAANGTAAIDSAGNWTYTPSAHYNGSDSFTVQVTDDDGNVETQVISITVTQVNDAGTFGGDVSATTNEDTATAGTVTFVDTADGFTTPNFTLLSAATNGTAAIDSAGNWTYTPSAHYNGADSFTVQVTDDDGNVETQVISINVTQVNDAGSFGGDTAATTNEDTATAGTVTFVDTADGFTTPNFTLLSAATNGTAAIDSAGNWTYSPSAHYNGADSFTVQVTDDDGNVETQVISITVTQVNDAGSFGGDTAATTNEDTATAGTVTFVDTADGFTTPNFTLLSAATNGTAAIDSAGNWTYTPSANYNGADSFTVQVTDDDGNVETQVINITVTAVNDAGVFGGDVSAIINEGAAVTGIATFTDTIEGYSTNNFTMSSAAAHGTATINTTGDWTYAPTNNNYNGTDSFTVQVIDDEGYIETLVINITITQVNDFGLFSGNLSATTNEDTSTTGTVTFTDTIDGYTINNFAINSPATNGTATITASGSWTYVPSANYNGPDSFTVQVTDDDGNVETQVINITVLPITDMGVFSGNLSATGVEDTPTGGLISFTDPDDGYSTNNFTIHTAASNGIAAINAAGNWTYTPNAGFNGSDYFTVQVIDDEGNVETQVITLSISGVNDAPVALGTYDYTINDTVASDVFDKLSGKLVATDIDHATSSLTWRISSGIGSYGSLSVAPDGAFVYSPDVAAINTLAFGERPIDQFTVTVTDPSGASDTRAIRIQLIGADDFIETTATDPVNPSGPSEPTVQLSLAELAAFEQNDKKSKAEVPPEILLYDESIRSLSQGSKLTETQYINKITVTDTANSDAKASSSSVKKTEILPTRNTLNPTLFSVQYENIAYQFNQTNNTGSALETTAVNFEQVQLHNDNQKFVLQNSSSGAVKVTGVAVTASAVWWALRATGLLASVMTSLPAWRQVDVLSVLPQAGEAPDNNDVYDFLNSDYNLF